MKVAEMSLVSRVQAGAEWLDEHYPGWEDKVDTFTLSMSAGNQCVLGQVGRNMAADQLDRVEFSFFVGNPYAAMLELHARPWNWSSEYGFCAPEGDPLMPWADQAQLIWISEIHRRRTGDID